MRILLLTLYYPPDNGSAAHLFYELGTSLVERGHEVTVLTTMPGYHAESAELRRYEGRWRLVEEIDGTRVIRVGFPRFSRRSMVGRALWHFGSAAVLAWKGLRAPAQDAALVYSPPLTLGLTATLLKWLRGTPFALNVQDLFPQSIIDLGLLRNRLIIRSFEAIERWLYRRADVITVHSEGNRDHVAERLERAEKIHVIHNWVDTDFIRADGDGSELRSRLGLEGRFVISFAGVLGYSQDLDVVLEAADRLRTDTDLAWLIVGDGVEKERLEAKASELRLSNVTFLPMQPRNEYPGILYASDACLATLKAHVKTPVVPSKILSIMSAGRPVLAALDPEGDAAALIEEAEAGLCVPPEDPAALARAISRLRGEPGLCPRLGEQGRTHAVAELSLDRAVGEYESLLQNLNGS